MRNPLRLSKKIKLKIKNESFPVEERHEKDNFLKKMISAFLTGVDVELIQRCGRRHIINAKKEMQRKARAAYVRRKSPKEKG